MKFRIIKYYDRYQAQVYKNDKYIDIGSPNGYSTVTEAEMECKVYKFCEDDKVVKEFEL